MTTSSVSTKLTAIVVPVLRCICNSLIGESLLQRWATSSVVYKKSPHPKDVMRLSLPCLRPRLQKLYRLWNGSLPPYTDLICQSASGRLPLHPLRSTKFCDSSFHHFSKIILQGTLACLVTASRVTKLGYKMVIIEMRMLALLGCWWTCLIRVIGYMIFDFLYDRMMILTDAK